MILHTRLLRGTTALSSSTPSLLRLSSAHDQRRARHYLHVPRSALSGAVFLAMYMHTIVVWLPVLPPVPPSARTEVRAPPALTAPSPANE